MRYQHRSMSKMRWRSQNSINKFTENKTVIPYSQDVPIEKADKIVVMADAKAASAGKHEELLRAETLWRCGGWKITAHRGVHLLDTASQDQ